MEAVLYGLIVVTQSTANDISLKEAEHEDKMRLLPAHKTQDSRPPWTTADFSTVVFLPHTHNWQVKTL
jgi:hypothetical protein